MRFGIIGLGLIGGSLGKTLQLVFPESTVLGCDVNEVHQSKALELQLVDEILGLEDLVQHSDVVFICIPVNAILNISNQILDLVDDSTLVIDFGSTKQSIRERILAHQNRRNWVLAHPMAGTEYSGPEAAVNGLFQNRLCVVCNQEEAPLATDIASQLLQDLGMRISKMDAQEHDIHAAYISHLSHISSFALSNAVLEEESKGVNQIRLMAGAGFRSTVRLAKSNADMWAPILLDNKKYLLPALQDYIQKLQAYAEAMETSDMKRLKEMMVQANQVGPIVDLELESNPKLN